MDSTQAFSTKMALDASQAFGLERKVKSKETPAELKKQSKAFEAVFINQMLTQMDKTIDRDPEGLLSGGAAEGQFRGLLYQNIAENIAQTPGGSGFGFAESVYKQMEKRLPKEAKPVEHTQSRKVSDPTFRVGAGQEQAMH
jgi:Rod binding domain-containing protein